MNLPNHRTLFFSLLFVVALLVVSLVSLPPATADDEAMASLVSNSEGLQFMAIPGIPACAEGTVLRGDPFKGAALLFLRADAGCNIPWHWHNSNEEVMLVSGAGRVQMKDGAAVDLAPGGYAFLPITHVHRFRTSARSTFFLAIDRAFDIHYIDKDGKEIAPEEAFKMGKADW